MTFDLAVVGGGSAGFAAAVKGVELGARVALIEGGTLGGTCVNVGCVPSKTLLRAAEVQQRRAHHPFAGVPATNGRPDWAAIRGQKDELVGQLRKSKYRDVLDSYEGITLFDQRAALVSGQAIRLGDGRTLQAGKIIVATGSSPWAPTIPGLADAGYLDNASAMELDQLPRSLMVIGASAVGLELGQMFARLGVRVSLLEVQPRILPAEDPHVGEALAGFLRDEGIEIRVGAVIERVRRVDPGYTVAWRSGSEAGESSAEQLLVATGRRANTAELGLEIAGVALGPKGEIRVNDFLQTANPLVYAAGDVLGDPMFVYVAAQAGAVAAENALGENERRYDLGAVPAVTFTDPAVASIGLNETDAREAGLAPLVTRLSLEHVPRALAARDTRGFIKLIADSGTRRLLGAQILAAEAGEMITEAALAIRFGLTIDDLTSTLHPYLTLSEGIRLAAQSFDLDVARLSCCAA